MTSDAPNDALFTRLRLEEGMHPSQGTTSSHNIHGIPTTIVYMPSCNYNVLFISQKSSALGALYKCTSEAHTRHNIDIECIFGAKESGDELEVVIARRIYQFFRTRQARLSDQAFEVEKPLLLSLLFDRNAIESAGLSDKQFAIDLIQLVEDTFSPKPV